MAGDSETLFRPIDIIDRPLECASGRAARDGSSPRDVAAGWLICLALFAALAGLARLSPRDGPLPVTPAEASAALHFAAPAPPIHG